MNTHTHTHIHIIHTHTHTHTQLVFFKGNIVKVENVMLQHSNKDNLNLKKILSKLVRAWFYFGISLCQT